MSKFGVQNLERSLREAKFSLTNGSLMTGIATVQGYHARLNNELRSRGKPDEQQCSSFQDLRLKYQYCLTVTIQLHDTKVTDVDMPKTKENKSVLQKMIDEMQNTLIESKSGVPISSSKSSPGSD